MITFPVTATLTPKVLVSSLIAPRRNEHIPILAYHQVHSTSRDSLSSPYAVSCAQFEQQMAFLYKEGYCSISLNELIAMRQQITIPIRKYFVLTFDDGYRDNYLKAFPVLQEFGFHATVFLVSDWFLRGNSGGNILASLLQIGDITEMWENGFTFGAHSCSHRSLTALAPGEAELEIRGSKEALEDELKQPIEFFSYPYGHSDPVVRSIVKASGFKAACATENGSNSLLNLRRIVILADDTLLDFKFKIRGWDGIPLRVLKWIERELDYR